MESVDAELSRQGAGGPWESLFEGAANSGSLPWLVAGPSSDSCFLRVRARDFQGNVALSAPAGPFAIGTPVTGVADGFATRVPLLNRPWSSPASSSFRVSFELPVAEPVRLSLFDVQGREVVRIRDGGFAAGRHEVEVPVRALSPGLFFVRLRTPSVDISRRVVIIAP